MGPPEGHAATKKEQHVRVRRPAGEAAGFRYLPAQGFRQNEMRLPTLLKCRR
jgi:hypothetical protein